MKTVANENISQIDKKESLHRWKNVEDKNNIVKSCYQSFKDMMKRLKTRYLKNYEITNFLDFEVQR